MAAVDAGRPTSRPGGRSSRIRAAVLAATAEVLDEVGFERIELPAVARRAGVHPTTIYRRWHTKVRLVGEALLERSQTLSPTPDTGSLAGDLRSLLSDGAILIRTPAVAALFQVLVAGPTDAAAEFAVARDRFWTAHIAEASTIVKRAVARSELPAETDPAALIDLVLAPVLLRLLLMGQELEESDIEGIVGRAIARLEVSGSRTP